VVIARQLVGIGRLGMFTLQEGLVQAAGNDLLDDAARRRAAASRSPQPSACEKAMDGMPNR
jgi:hypothetical protein